MDSMMNETANNKTIIARKCKIVGEISVNDDLLVYGEVKGNVNCVNDMVVGGSVEGDVEARELRVHGKAENNGKAGAIYGQVAVANCIVNGKIEGDCHIEGDMIVGSTAELIGEINAGSIEIQKGAALKGSLNINNQG